MTEALSEVAEIVVNLGEHNSYSIHVGSGILDKCGRYLQEVGLTGRVLVITTPQVDRLYGPTVIKSLQESGYQTRLLQLPTGEEYKNITTVSRIYDVLIDSSFDRQDTILTLGGGVTGDLAGFAAATYMRGINYVHVPTTLLAQVDSAIGGKTGFNHHAGKNLVGAFYQPVLVLCDIKTLYSLPERELKTGIAEVIKYGLIKSKTFYDFLQKKLVNGVYTSKDGLLLKEDDLLQIVEKCCSFKAAIIEKDEKDQNLRAILNFGHTFGHAIETATDYKKYTHGEAIALGMLAAVELSASKGYEVEGLFNELIDLYKILKLPLRLTQSVDKRLIFNLMKNDKKANAGKMRFVLLKKTGKAVVEELEDEELIYNSIESIIKREV